MSSFFPASFQLLIEYLISGNKLTYLTSSEGMKIPTGTSNRPLFILSQSNENYINNWKFKCYKNVKSTSTSHNMAMLN